MVSALRATIAPTVPQMIACRCLWRGTLRDASAMTIALSPASTRSITTMAASAARNSMLKTSKIPSPTIRAVRVAPPDGLHDNAGAAYGQFEYY
jgi:hypothetical protein